MATLPNPRLRSRSGSVTLRRRPRRALMSMHICMNENYLLFSFPLRRPISGVLVKDFSWYGKENRSKSPFYPTMPPKVSSLWSPIGTVTLRKQRFVERNADVYRVRSITSRHAEFGQSIDGKIVRHLALALSGETVTVEGAEKELRRSGLSMPYQYGHKLHFFAQDVLIVLVASGQASHRAVGQRFEYDIA